MSTIARLALVPRDGIFCKDGRGWHTSASGRGHGLDWPWPSTILGALRTAWGWEEESTIDRAFQPQEWLDKTATISLQRTLVLRKSLHGQWESEHRVWPVPSDALALEVHEFVHRLDPLPPTLATLGIDDDDAREALWVPGPPPEESKPVLPPRWWGEGRFVDWLCGETIPAHDEASSFKPSRRVQTHVGISPESFTAHEGVLFSHDVVETLEKRAEWAIGTEVVLPDGARSDRFTQGFSTLGADQRLMRREPLAAEAFAPPQELLKTFGKGSSGLRLVVVTPAYFERGWLPDGLDKCGQEYRGRLQGISAEVILRAAFVPRPVHISGWDMANCRPKSTSRMVASGAVYFFERTDAEPFREADAEALWLGALGSRTAEGFGRVVPGVWRPVRTAA